MPPKAAIAAVRRQFTGALAASFCAMISLRPASTAAVMACTATRRQGTFLYHWPGAQLLCKLRGAAGKRGTPTEHYTGSSSQSDNLYDTGAKQMARTL